MAPLIFNLNMVRCCSTICFSLAVNFFVYVARYSTSRSFLFSFFSFGLIQLCLLSAFPFFLLVELVLGSCPEDDETESVGLSFSCRRITVVLQAFFAMLCEQSPPLRRSFNEEPASLSLLVAKTFSTNCSSVKYVSTVAV